MRPIENINDADHLKQIALLLEKENTKLHARLEKALREVAELRGEVPDETIQLELTKIQAEMSRLERRLHGNPSERRSHDKQEDQEPKKKQGHGPRPQPQLETREEVHDLYSHQRTCPSCEGDVELWPGQYEESEEITVVRRRFELVKHRRRKYRCRCNGAVVTADGPQKLIPGGRYSIAFALSVAIDKYLDHLPLERQVRAMARQGLEVTSQTLWDQLEAMAKVLEPSLHRLETRVLASPVVHADETWWRLMNGKPAKNWWAWGLTTPEAVLYRILPTRSNESARVALAGFSGVLVADAYSVYKSLARDGPMRFTLAHCWAHARRKYVEIEQFYPDKCKEIINLIGELYAVERDVAPELEGDELLASRQELRDARSRAIIDQIREWAYVQACTPGSELRKAIDYMLRIWQGLTRFLDDPRVPLDNNAAERALRGPILGRKNHYGSRSVRGTEVAALYYSLLETAKLIGVDPEIYLETAVRRALSMPGVGVLPHDLL